MVLLKQCDSGELTDQLALTDTPTVNPVTTVTLATVAITESLPHISMHCNVLKGTQGTSVHCSLHCRTVYNGTAMHSLHFSAVHRVLLHKTFERMFTPLRLHVSHVTCYVFDFSSFDLDFLCWVVELVGEGLLSPGLCSLV